MNYPIVLCYVKRETKNLHFYTPAGIVTVTGDTDAIDQILSWCDGNTPLATLLDKARNEGLDPISVKHLLFSLKNRGIVSDVSTASLQAVRFWKNPSPWFKAVTLDELHSIQSDRARECKGEEGDFQIFVDSEILNGLAIQRRSIRIFGSKPLNESEFRCIVASGFGSLKRGFDVGGDQIPARTIPSGGALYPIDVLVGVFDDSGPIPTGSYRLSGSGKSLIPINADPHSFYDCIGADNITGKPYCAIVFVCNLSHSPKKYGNRAVLFSILEAGHAAQNVQLEATRLGLASLEWGGLDEEAFVQLTDLDWPDNFPAIAVLVGSSS